VRKQILNLSPDDICSEKACMLLIRLINLRNVFASSKLCLLLRL